MIRFNHLLLKRFFTGRFPWVERYFSHVDKSRLARQMQYHRKSQLMKKTIVLNLAVILVYYLMLRAFLPY